METAAHKYSDLRLTGTRRMMMLTPETSSCYLTTNQLEEHELIRHPETHIPSVAFFKTKQNNTLP